MDYQSREYFSPDQLNQEPITQTVESMGIKSPEMPTLNEKTISEIKAERDGVQVSWNLFDWIRDSGGIKEIGKQGLQTYIRGKIIEGITGAAQGIAEEESTLVKVALTPYQIRQSRDYLDHTQGVQAVCNSLPVPTQWGAKYLHYADPIQNLCIYKR